MTASLEIPSRAILHGEIAWQCRCGADVLMRLDGLNADEAEGLLEEQQGLCNECLYELQRDIARDNALQSDLEAFQIDNSSPKN